MSKNKKVEAFIYSTELERVVDGDTIDTMLTLALMLNYINKDVV